MNRSTNAILVAIAALAGCTSSPFGVRPEIQNVGDSGEGRGEITISFEIWDDDLTWPSVAVEYRASDGVLRKATLTDASVEGVEARLDPNAGNVLLVERWVGDWTPCTVTWDSLADGVALDGQDTVTIRLTPSDFDGVGEPVEYDLTVCNFYPTLDVDRTTLSFEYVDGSGQNPPAQVVQVENAGPENTILKWSAAETPEAAWLTVAPASGTRAWDDPGEPVSFTVDAAGLGVGDHEAYVEFTGTDLAGGAAHGSPRVVHVTLTVREPRPEISIEDSAGAALTDLYFTATPGGGNPASQSFFVENSGEAGSVLAWTATDDLTSPDWLSYSPVSENTPAGSSTEVAVSVDAGSLGTGTYTAEITVSAPGAAGSPKTVTVHLTVGEAPVLSVTPGTLTFQATEGGANPASQTLSISNPGGGTLDWSVSDDAAWLTLSPSSGSCSVETDTVAVSVNVSGLAAATYNATITVSAPGASNSPRTVAVTLDVRAPEYALQLQTDDCIVFNIGKAAFPTTGYTWECWVKLDQLPKNYCLCAIDTAWGQDIGLVTYDAGGGTVMGFEFYVYDNAWNGPNRSVKYTPPGGADLGRWYHLAGVADYQGGRLYLYVDGQQVGQTAWDLTPLDRDITFFVGKHNEGWTQFGGIIDEVRVWDGARTAGEIQANMRAHLTGTESGLIAYWDFNEGSDQVVYDKTGHGYDGSLGATFAVEADDPVWTTDTPWSPIELSTMSITFDNAVAGESDPDPKTVQVTLTNADDSSFAWETQVIYGGAETGWLDVSPDSGTLPAGGNVDVSVTAETVLTGLGAGEYTATLRFQAQGKPAEREDIAVSLRVWNSNGGLIAHWKFDETSGQTAYDSSGNANDGTLANGPVWQPTGGKIGGALQFDGSDDCVDVSHAPALNAFPITITAWINTTAGGTGRGIVNKYVSGSWNGYSIGMSDGRIGAHYIRDSSNYVYKPGGMDGGLANDGQWHCAALSIGPVGGKLYVDGVLRDSLPWTGTAGGPTTTQPLSFGRYPGNNLFAGLVDDVRIYNRALSAAEIAALFAEGQDETWVATDGNDLTGDGSYGSPYRTIGKAMSVAVPGDIVVVQAGTYQENVQIPSNGITLRSESGAPSTIIQGAGSGDGIRVPSSTGPTNVLIEGFTIKGFATGIYAYDGASIKNCILEQNTSSAVHIWYAKECTVAGNIFRNNSGSKCLGMIGYHSGNASICSNNLFHGNTVSSRLVFLDSYGGPEDQLVFENNTLADNTGNAVYVWNGGGVRVSSNIIADNLGSGIVKGPYDMARLYSNDVYGNTTNYDGFTDMTGVNDNISADPAFVGLGDYRIRSTSPCKDAGYDIDTLLSEDLGGEPRIVDGSVDMGCYEWQPGDP